jgi:uncharacterized membrane protein
MLKLPLLDVLAVAWFATCWIGYAWVCDRAHHGERGLLKSVHRYREEWLRVLLKRENRIVDSALVGNLVQSVSFFASTSIFIIGGLFALLGYGERAIEIAAELPMAKVTSRELWELKVLVLVGVFFYSFFKFTWSLRQYNVLSIMIGAAPAPGASAAEQEEFVAKATCISTYAGDEFVRGMRGYYFGMAAVTWFIQPWLFVSVTTLVVAVQYWRDFDSPSVRAMRGKGPASGR